METQYYYIHGLKQNSISGNSKKFIELQKQYSNIILFEWNINDNISKKLQIWTKQILTIQRENKVNHCIIASSTGANFAYQLKKLLKKNQYCHLVLINPLLDLFSLFDKKIIPENLKQYIENIYYLKDSLILIANKDKVINFKKFKSKIIEWNQIIFDDQATHKFETLNNYYTDIDKYINNLYL